MSNDLDKQPKNKGHRWKPGQSGNPKGRPTNDKSATNILRQYMSECDDGCTQSRLMRMARVLWSMALGGDLGAIKLIYDRLDGSPKQSVEASVSTVTIEWEDGWV